MQTVFTESFETDGDGARYSVENGSDDGSNDFFARRQVGSPGVTPSGGTVDGDFVWGARDIDGEGVATGELESDEARITWTDTIDITGLGNLQISMAAAAGGAEVEFDNALEIQVRIDGGDWRTIGGFRGVFTNSWARYFQGDETTLPPLDNPQLSTTFDDFSWDLSGFGNTMEIRIKINANGSTEEYAFDNIRVTGDDAATQVSMSMDAASYAEDAGVGGATLTLSTANPAPAGGLTLNLSTDDVDTYSQDISIPDTATIAEGNTNVDVPIDIIADNRFDGDQLVRIDIEGSGVSRNFTTFTVENVDAEPTGLIINEFLSDPPGSVDADLVGDSNGDGIRSSSEDEFVEIVNNTGSAIDLSGWNLTDEIGIRHTFPEGSTLPQGRAIVVFGGGNPTGVFGGAVVQTASQGNLGWSNSGDTISVVAGGAVVTAISYDGDIGGSDQGFSRNPDLSGAEDSTDMFDLYDEIATTDALFTPGTQLDGSPFGDFDNTVTLELDTETVAEGAGSGAVSGTITLESAAPAGGLTLTLESAGVDQGEIAFPASEVTVAETESTANFTIDVLSDGILDGDATFTVVATAPDVVPGSDTLTVTNIEENPFNIVINEVFGSVAGTGLDPNNDGNVEQPVEDQYIEIVNAGSEAVDINGWLLYSYEPNSITGPQVVHDFDTDSLPAGGAIIIFGGVDEDEANAEGNDAFGGAIVEEADEFDGVNIPTGSDGTVEIRTPENFIIDKVEFLAEDANQSQALVRDPDITGGFPNLHIQVSDQFLLASPGTDVNGNAFASSGGTDPEPEVEDNELLNISTRTLVGSDAFTDVANASIIIGGSDPMTVVFRGRSTSISDTVTAAKLSDPTIDVVQVGTGVIGTNNNWADAENLDLLTGTDLDPNTVGMDANESLLILEDLAPGAYSVRVSSNVEAETGLVIAEAFAVRDGEAVEDNELLNISTRSQVGTAEFTDISNSSIIIGGSDPMTVVFRGRSTSISDTVTAAKLSDPIIDVVRVGEGVIATNDNWADADNVDLLTGTDLDPNTVGMDANESILVLQDLAPGAYSVRVRSNVEGEAGLAISEAFAVRE